MTEAALHVPVHPVRIVTAASLFDGHDAAINIMRRILQSQGCEVIHLGHNRSVDEIVTAVVQEDVQGVAVSSYQGGHDEYFRYLVDRLRAEGAGDVRVYGGGGGVIVASEIEALEAYGVTKIFSPDDGQRMGLAPMINTIVAACDVDPAADPLDLDRRRAGGPPSLARPGHHRPGARSRAAAACSTGLRAAAAPRPPPRCSASPAPAVRASRRSPTSWSAGSGSTRRTSSGSRCWRSTRPAAAAAARCSATASA